MTDLVTARLRKQIIDLVENQGSYHLRYFTQTYSNGNTVRRNKGLYDALMQLNNEYKVHIIRRRSFGTTFLDQSAIKGVAITVVAF